MTCSTCSALEAKADPRGIYIHEAGDPATRASFGPYCSNRCAWLAVHKGAIRTQSYTMRKHHTKASAKLWERNALPISAAPQDANPWWELQLFEPPIDIA